MEEVRQAGCVLEELPPEPPCLHLSFQLRVEGGAWRKRARGKLGNGGLNEGRHHEIEHARKCARKECY